MNQELRASGEAQVHQSGNVVSVRVEIEGAAASWYMLGKTARFCAEEVAQAIREDQER